MKSLAKLFYLQYFFYFQNMREGIIKDMERQERKKNRIVGTETSGTQTATPINKEGVS